MTWRSRVRVHLLRHGQSQVNLAGQTAGANGVNSNEVYYSDEFPDSQLTALGEAQARGAFDTNIAQPRFAAVLVSPLRRTLQTAHHAAYRGGLHDGRTRWYACDACRETLQEVFDGVWADTKLTRRKPCNMRGKLFDSAYRASVDDADYLSAHEAFPYISFDRFCTVEDTLKPLETLADLDARVQEFLGILNTISKEAALEASDGGAEATIDVLVVSHFVFLVRLQSHFLLASAEQQDPRMTNCEVRVIPLADFSE